ncbi:MAG: hypothetical protein AAFU79_06825 [Myxococcota bacterium]
MTMAAGWVAYTLSQRAQNRAEALLYALEQSGTGLRFESRRWSWHRTEGVGHFGPRSVAIRLDARAGEPRVSVSMRVRHPETVRLHIQVGEQMRWTLGDEGLAAGLLSGAVRQALRAGDELLIGEGGLTLITHHPESARHAALALDALADRLERVGDGPARRALLIDTAVHDPSPEARAEAVPFVLSLDPGLARVLAEDAAPEVRLAVARVVQGEIGFELARQILTSEIFHPETRHAALRHLVSHHPPQTVGPVLVNALGAADESLLGALVPALASLGEAGAGAALRSQLPTAGWANSARIAEALATLEGAAAEPDLLRLLDRLPVEGPSLTDEREMAVSVADALGRVGGRDALPRLATLAARVPAESPTGIAVKVALELIAARAGATDETRGALAVVGASTVEGRLSPPN